MSTCTTPFSYYSTIYKTQININVTARYCNDTTVANKNMYFTSLVIMSRLLQV